MPEIIKADLIDLFSAVTKQRDGLKSEFIKASTQVETARDRYKAIMQELEKIGIGSVDELKSKIIELEESIRTRLVEAQNYMNSIREAA